MCPHAPRPRRIVLAAASSDQQHRFYETGPRRFATATASRRRSAAARRGAGAGHRRRGVVLGLRTVGLAVLGGADARDHRLERDVRPVGRAAPPRPVRHALRPRPRRRDRVGDTTTALRHARRHHRRGRRPRRSTSSPGTRAATSRATATACGGRARSSGRPRPSTATRCSASSHPDESSVAVPGASLRWPRDAPSRTSPALGLRPRGGDHAHRVREGHGEEPRRDDRGHRDELHDRRAGTPPDAGDDRGDGGLGAADLDDGARWRARAFHLSPGHYVVTTGHAYADVTLEAGATVRVDLTARCA